MKKMLVTSAAIALAAMTVSAAPGDVYSSNIVGYQKVTLPAGLNLMGTSWQAVGATDQVTLGDLFDPSGLTSYSADFLTAGDSVDTWDLAAGTWGPTYYYVNQPGWNYDAVDYTTTWMDPGFVPVDPLLDSGSAVWLLLNAPQAVATKGEVPTGAKALTLKTGYNLLANPFPYERDWNSGAISGTGMTTYSVDFLTAGDSIDTWDLAAGGWGPSYYYVNQPSWNYDAVDYTDTWMDAGFVPVNLTVGPNVGFWYIAIADGVALTFSAL